MADLAKKLKIREGRRGLATRRLADADRLLEQIEAGTEPDPVQLAQVRLALKEKLEALRKVDEEIVALIDDGDEVIREIEDADAFNDDISNKLVALDRHVESKGATGGSHTSKARLPKLNLPVFSGDIMEWTTFWDSYDTAVHQNTDLSDVEKFTYLKTLVSKTAKEAISGLTLTSANYKEAIKLLKERFGKRERIISRHMDSLLNLEAVSWQGNTAGLRALYDKVETHTRELLALGVAAEAYNSLLPSLLMKKLPNELCLAISRRIPEDAWNLDSIMKELSDELRARERTALERKRTNEEKHSYSKGASFKPTSTTLHTRAYSCHYCEGSHESEACLKVATVTDRRQFIRESGRCFLCLRKGHVSRLCRSSGKCKHCHGRHHSSICLKLNEKSESTGDSEQGQKKGTGLDPKASPFKSTTLLTDASGTVLLQTARATVVNTDNEKRVEMRLIFDSGSQRSYISERAKRLLSLRVVGKRDMHINTFGSSESKEQSCPIVRVNVEVRDDKAIAMRLLTIPLICESMTGISFNQCLQDCEHLQGLSLADDINDGEVVEFDLLVGLDYYWEFLTGETIQGRNGPTAVYSKLGWVLSGPVAANSTALITHVLTTASQEKSSLGDQLCKFWDLEALGIKEEESTVYDQFSDQVKFNGTRYEVSLPWKDTALEIPSNYELSLRRLNSLMRRLKRDPSLLIEYNKVIEDQISSGIVEVVVDPMKNDGDRIHYLPHHAVIRQDKQTTKVRVVYDASAKDKGLSLNDCLHVGPKFDQGIFELLLQFRVHKYAFTADVEKAFLMIAIEKSDRDALRFLWVKDIWQNPPEILVLRFARVTFGVAPSPFLLNATIRYHIERYRDAHPLLVKKLARSMYVDDVVSGAATAEEGIQMYEGFKDILKEGGFNLRKFVPSQLASAETTEVSGELSKVLGIPWNPSTDELIMDLRPVVDEADSLTPTKRHVVSVISRAYDPMGIVSPVVVRLKIFLQELHNAKIGWDEHIPDKLLKRWNDIVSSMKDSEPIIISRCYLQDLNCNATKASLCGFCDASTRAYAAVVYMLCEMDDGLKKIAFVSSKTRVAPLKEHSILRLELLGALLLARLMSSISNALKEEIKLGDPVCYTDSLVALYWIKGVGRSWKPFVDNRVREIRGLVPVTYWKHCSGDMNPADIPSRGLTMQELLSNKAWLQGPSWLTERDREFEEIEREIPEDCVKELRADERRECGLLVKECEISKLIGIEKYGSLEKLLRVTAYVLQFVSLVKKRDCLSERECFSTFITRAELFWVKESQSVFHDNVKFQSEKRQLQLFTDTEGIWRCGGRILNADVPYSTKHPVLLPGGHYFTSLVVLRSHQRVFHNGVRETLSEVRAKYWIMRGRSVVKKILRQCVICRKAEGRHYSVPDPPPLPAYRVTEKPPFTSIGVDFAGPLYIRRGFETSESKAWLCLYTCCVTRAIHLDLLTNMSLEYFFRSFRRFVARRGLPERVISDNAKTFKGAAKIFKEIMNHRDVEQYLEGARIQWNFNVEKAPWWGGIFERLIRSVKRCLRKVIGRARLTYDELLTIIVETEMIINSRPLSYVSSDDLYEAITPSHLINGRRLLSIPDNFCRGDEDDEDFEVTRTVLTKRMKFIDRTLTQFWNRWRAEYLLELREAHRYGVGVTNGTEIAVGDIVVVHSDEKRRGFWNLAKVEETIFGKDGNIRGAVIRVFTGGKHSKLLRRPIQRLYPLEVKDESVVSDTPASIENDVPMIPDSVQSEDRDEEPVIAPENRSRRAAASEARDKILAYSVQ